MRVIMFTAYSRETHEYLRKLEHNDVSRLDAMIESGSEPTFICSHYRADGGWRKGISGTSNALPGEYLDENGLWVSQNDFYEWHGGERVFYKRTKK